MVSGTLVDMAIGTYSSTDVIIFHKILSGRQLYLEVIFTVDDVESVPYYFKWNEIPKEIYAIYIHTKVHSDIKFDSETNMYSIIGTHLLRKKEYKFVLAKFSARDFPLLKNSVEFTKVCSTISDLSDDDAKFYTELAADMQVVKHDDDSFSQI